MLPQQAVQESLLEALGDVAGRRVLVATAEGARDVLADGLRERGAEVDELAALPHRAPSRSTPRRCGRPTW